MNLNELKKSLSKLPLGDVRYFETIGSTNDEALAWAATDTPDLSVVIADEQTAGRGRLDRKWFTPRGTALAFSIVLRLPWEVNPLFQQWLEQHFPERAQRVMARVREMRDGRDNDPRFGTRMRGEGIWAMLLRQRFDKACARLGLNRERVELDLGAFRPPAAQAGQGSLF